MKLMNAYVRTNFSKNDEFSRTFYTYSSKLNISLAEPLLEKLLLANLALSMVDAAVPEAPMLYYILLIEIGISYFLM